MSRLTGPKASRISCGLHTFEALRVTWLTFLVILEELLFHFFSLHCHPAEVLARRRIVQ